MYVYKHIIIRRMKNLIIRMLIRGSLIIVGVLGILFTFLSSSFMGGASVFLFFTVQSNITIILITLVFLINDFLLLFNKKPYVSQFLLILKYIFTIAITITFLVFFTMLAPLLGVDYLLSFNNFSLHAIVPILAIVDFFIFNTDIELSIPKSLLGTAMPIYYVIFVYIGVPLGFEYMEGLKFPYFFLNYEKNGWFNISKDGIGVFYWIIILMIGIIGLCLLFYLFMRIRKKHIKE